MQGRDLRATPSLASPIIRGSGAPDTSVVTAELPAVDILAPIDGLEQPEVQRGDAYSQGALFNPAHAPGLSSTYNGHSTGGDILWNGSSGVAMTALPRGW